MAGFGLLEENNQGTWRKAPGASRSNFHSQYQTFCRDEAVTLEMKRKTQTEPELLCACLPEAFAAFFRHVHQLGFEEQPNYAWLRKNFQDAFEAKGFKCDDGSLDWESAERFNADNLLDWEWRTRQNDDLWALMGP